MVAHMSQLCKEHGMPTLPLPDVLVLEAPFNNLMDEIESHPFSKVIPLIQGAKNQYRKVITSTAEMELHLFQRLWSKAWYKSSQIITRILEDV